MINAERHPAMIAVQNLKALLAVRFGRGGLILPMTGLAIAGSPVQRIFATLIEIFIRHDFGQTMRFARRLSAK
jgi:hypothetical protein